jgi:hypothetical protein
MVCPNPRLPSHLVSEWYAKQPDHTHVVNATHPARPENGDLWAARRAKCHELNHTDGAPGWTLKPKHFVRACVERR